MRNVGVAAGFALRADEVDVRDAGVIGVKPDDDGGVRPEMPFGVVPAVREEVHEVADSRESSMGQA